MQKRRLDDLLLEKGWAKDRREAFVVVTEGRVLVGGQKAISPAQLVPGDALIEISEERKYVGRGAYKLDAAISKFGIVIKDKICADVGSATGGFTEILLKYGAKKVYAIDTARGKLALKLRRDPRVIVMEERDARDLVLPEKVDFVSIDVSLISLRVILPVARERLLKKDGAAVSLFKPQYETRDPKILSHGVIKDSGDREKLLASFIEWALEHEWYIIDSMESPIRGSEGNIEYLIYLKPII